jgi:hypothetical protein
MRLFADLGRLVLVLRHFAESRIIDCDRESDIDVEVVNTKRPSELSRNQPENKLGDLEDMAGLAFLDRTAPTSTSLGSASPQSSYASLPSSADVS